MPAKSAGFFHFCCQLDFLTWRVLFTLDFDSEGAQTDDDIAFALVE